MIKCCSILTSEKTEKILKQILKLVGEDYLPNHEAKEGFAKEKVQTNYESESIGVEKSLEGRLNPNGGAEARVFDCC